MLRIITGSARTTPSRCSFWREKRCGFIADRLDLLQQLLDAGQRRIVGDGSALGGEIHAGV